ncbi:hypothetical protein JTE90_005445 [Oedothorax gibbosus]|uniref:Uncharacterized protein n=1 Tax=Oedothorax gibbosus TaxID=931172 RepID=A0AAV6TIH1_9ARAC|nr:hypothetical protein JTE90_005445 [Oedothorax gibbosus]
MIRRERTRVRDKPYKVVPRTNSVLSVTWPARDPNKPRPVAVVRPMDYLGRIIEPVEPGGEQTSTTTPPPPVSTAQLSRPQFENPHLVPSL